jgi:Mg/Co/Ni transporter MgtE
LAFHSRTPFWTFIYKQIFVSLLIGFFSSLVIGTETLIAGYPPFLGLTIATATLIAFLTATSVPVRVPHLLQKSGQVPANGTGPYATIIQDILSS